jgi:hypothetical protein
MKTLNAEPEPIALFVQRLKRTALRSNLSSVGLTAMVFVLVAAGGVLATLAASRPSSSTLSSPAPLAVEGKCAGRMTETYYDSSRGDPLVYSSEFLSDVFTRGRAELKGYLYLPNQSKIADSPRNLPLIVFNHGSGQPVNEACEMATYFSDRGFAFFIPHRRGHGLSTGVYYNDYLDLVCLRSDENKFGVCGKILVDTLMLTYLQDETFEIAQAISYLSSLRNSDHKAIINPNKVAIMGHSFGGIVTLFNNKLLTNHNAAVDIAGASESWDYFDDEDGDDTPDNSPSITTLKNAVRGAQKPIFFLEPKNDVSIRPTVVLSSVAGNNSERYQAAIYPPVADVLSSAGAHGKFVTEHDQVIKWGPAVIEFLARNGVE